jgi:hypothetical protein
MFWPQWRLLADEFALVPRLPSRRRGHRLRLNLHSHPPGLVRRDQDAGPLPLTRAHFSFRRTPVLRLPEVRVRRTRLTCRREQLLKCRSGFGPNETPAAEAALVSETTIWMLFSLASTSAFTADCSPRRLSASPRGSLRATQMRSCAPSSVSWSTTIRCRLSSGRVCQAPRVPVHITALEVRPEGTGMDVDGRG